MRKVFQDPLKVDVNLSGRKPLVGSFYFLYLKGIFEEAVLSDYHRKDCRKYGFTHIR